MLPVAIAGATGYTGQELVRLLLKHPQVQITALTSEQWSGKSYAEVFPQFFQQTHLKLEPLDIPQLAQKAKLVFLCLPHQKAMESAQACLAQGLSVVDLSADFRLRSASIYEAWYGPHRFPDLLPQAVYGLPELYRQAISQAQLIANPGCYPTSVILGLAPLLKNRWIDLDTLHCDSKSGVSGAGRKAELQNLFCEIDGGFKAYKVGQHRHTPEIEQEVSRLAGSPVTLSFTPHLLPIDRGILSTLYARSLEPHTGEELHRLYTDFYKNEPFIRVRPLGTYPNTLEVRGSNFCDIGVHYDARTGRIVVVSVIDNLTKGASGQAVQNMNLMMGFPETLGLL